MMIDTKKLIDDVLMQVEALAQELFQDFSKEALADAKDFLSSSAKDLEDWTRELAAGSIAEDDFKDLVQGQIDVALLHGLKQTGIGEVEVDKFKNGVLQIIFTVAGDAAKSAV